jgi:hypothetical protein
MESDLFFSSNSRQVLSSVLVVCNLLLFICILKDCIVEVNIDFLVFFALGTAQTGFNFKWNQTNLYPKFKSLLPNNSVKYGTRSVLLGAWFQMIFFPRVVRLHPYNQNTN